ncbi:MAG TPA: UDP-2,3-diacylglucosamine diphosphatase [Bacteroidia bacterium]|jgi:UDP-2,3-diacylglucosamine pyrophosphatase LpxH|nr:UDP-2,3-diacylglucosamine diphosphatase [Bacteroidia bacterium]
MKTSYKTIVISDVHLGIKDSKVKELVRFLKAHSCEKLILNGDIIDGWQLKKSGSWKKKHTKFFRILMKAMEKQKTKVVYLRGNHDDFLEQILPFEIGNFSIALDHMHESFGKRYYVIHGDAFDTITTRMPWLSKLGDVSYTFLLWLNRNYNHYRTRRGLPYYSLSQVIKLKVKSAVSYISDYEQQLSEAAKRKKCDGIICGHIHQPANKMIGDVHYLNSGDWVESLTALTESFSGEWNVVHYSQWATSQESAKQPLEILRPEARPGILIPAFR